jgi:hypothetical protein
MPAILRILYITNIVPAAKIASVVTDSDGVTCDQVIQRAGGLLLDAIAEHREHPEILRIPGLIALVCDFCPYLV